MCATSLLRPVLLGITALCVLAATPAAQAPPSPSLTTRLEALRASAALPAVGGAVFDSTTTIDVAAVGVRKLGDDTPVTADDLWHIGSITKSFTSLLIGRFVERGDLAWTDTLQRLVGERAGAYGGVTIEYLLSHRAGLPANATPAMMAAVSQGGPPTATQRQRLVDEGLRTTPAAAPGAAFVYSNLGYVIAAAILEARTGKVWEDLVQAEVLTPLALASAGQGPPGVINALTQPRGHRGATPVEPGPFGDNPPYLGPAGRLHMTLADLARWGRAHLAGARGRDGLVTAATFTRLHTPTPPHTYALGWVSQTTNDRRVIWHNGSNTMWYAIVAFDPAADRGVVITTNGGIAAAQAVDAAAMALLR